MNSSAIVSSSKVDRPGRTSPRSRAIVRPRMRPPSAMMSISRGDLIWITRPSLRPDAERREGPRRDLGDRAHGIDAGHLRAVVPVPVEHWRGVALVDDEAVPHRLRLVVLAPHQLPAAAGHEAG